MIWLDFKITRESEERKLHFSYFKCELFELLLEKIKKLFCCCWYKYICFDTSVSNKVIYLIFKFLVRNDTCSSFDALAQKQKKQKKAPQYG